GSDEEIRKKLEELAKRKGKDLQLRRYNDPNEVEKSIREALKKGRTLIIIINGVFVVVSTDEDLIREIKRLIKESNPNKKTLDVTTEEDLEEVLRRIKKGSWSLEHHHHHH
uniref:NF3 n=1 Tax=synthetic construct TaxID=32630 RepID=UPI001AA00CF9|nr:Chain A, NF3 [synthetic construct]